MSRRGSSYKKEQRAVILHLKPSILEFSSSVVALHSVVCVVL